MKVSDILKISETLKILEILKFLKSLKISYNFESFVDLGSREIFSENLIIYEKIQKKIGYFEKFPNQTEPFELQCNSAMPQSIPLLRTLLVKSHS